MNRKVLILGLLLVLFSVSSLFAYVQEWHGTGSCNNETGIWKAKVENSTDPNYISGAWSCNQNYGKFKGNLYVPQPGASRTGSGNIYNNNNQIIGTWIGTFPPIGIDAQAFGTFNVSINGVSYQGNWQGQPL